MSVERASPGIGRPRSPRKFLLPAVGLAALAAFLGVVAWSFAPPPAPPPLPDPNGYDDLLAAARSIAGTAPKYAPQYAQIVRPADGPAARKLDPMNANWGEAAAYVLANREALARARVGLDRECAVPVAYERGYTFGSNANRAALKALARVFLWEAQIAVHDGRAADAVRSFLDMTRLGRAASRGGLEVDAWAGLDIEAGGMLGLYRAVDDLDPATCRRAIATLIELDRAREPYRDFAARSDEAQAADHGRLHTAAFHLISLRSRGAQATRMEEAYQETIAMTRLVRVELALRAHRAESGVEPARLDDLVPSDLPSVPVDPFSGRSPVYRVKAGGGHRLYSLGPDRVDGGGVPPVRAPGARTTGDLLPDSIGTTLVP